MAREPAPAIPLTPPARGPAPAPIPAPAPVPAVDLSALRPQSPAAPTDWPGLIAACPSRSIQAVLQGLKLRTFEPGRVVLEGPEGLARTATVRREELSQAVSRAAGRQVAIEIVVQEPAATADPAAPAAPAPPPGRAAPQPLAPSSMSDHPLVRQAGELLGARLIRVERRESSNG